MTPLSHSRLLGFNTWPHHHSGRNFTNLRAGRRRCDNAAPMTAMILFAVTLVLMGAAFAIPAAVVREGCIADNDATVLGGSVVALGLGGLNLVALLWAVVFGDEVRAEALGFGVLPLLGGGLGLRVVLRRLTGGARAVHLVVAALLVLAGIPGYFALNVALLAAVITAFLFLAGLIRDPRGLLKSLDPRI
jgi:hypothetical protein